MKTLLDREFGISHIYRKGNGVADKMAYVGLGLSDKVGGMVCHMMLRLKIGQIKCRNFSFRNFRLQVFPAQF